MIVKVIIWMVILAYLHACQETEIEGRAGWARHLPTFRINIFLTKILIGKEVTGYHIFMLLMFFIVFHSCYIFIAFSIKTELIILGLMSLYWVIEDFFFFLVNPYFGLKSFNKKRISWHKRWFFGIPVSYWTGLILGIWFLLAGVL